MSLERLPIDQIANDPRIRQAREANFSRITVQKKISLPVECPFADQVCWECRTGERAENYLSPEPHRVIYDVSECYHARLTRALLRASGLRAEDLEHTFALADRDQHNSRVIAYLESYDVQSGEGVYLYSPKTADNPGGNGTGKTYCLHALALAQIEKHYSVLFYSGWELMTKLRRCIQDEDPYAEEAFLAQLAECDLLIWDDIGKEHIPSDWGPEKIYAIIDMRLSRRKPIAFSSNFSPSELEHRLGPIYGPACASRIAGGCRIFKLSGPDRRLKR